MPSVLLIGEDDLLLQTRAAVLRTTGADAFCSKGASALALQADRQCDLIILCHSLPKQLAADLAHAIRARWPRTPILLVTRARLWESAEADEAVNAISSADPQHLVVRVTELLRQCLSHNGEAA